MGEKNIRKDRERVFFFWEGLNLSLKQDTAERT